MLVFIFRCPDYWRPKYASDLFNRKLVSIRLASPKTPAMLPNIGEGIMRVWLLVGSIILGYRPVQRTYAPAHLSREK